MLSTKTFLKGGRYRLDRRISNGPVASLYLAGDLLLKRPIAIIKIDRDDSTRVDFGTEGQSLARLQHDGLLRISDHFREGPSTYLTTEPLATDAETRTDVNYLFARLNTILYAIGELASTFPSIGSLELSPELFFTTHDNKLKLLSVYPEEILGWQRPLDSPYLALEQVWERLDHINQKAIYQSYDQQALAILESAPDARTDLYSIGAVFYRLLTGTAPRSALERSIEIVDSRVDPLRPPSEINPSIDDERSSFIMRLLELRREQRFESIEDAIICFPSALESSAPTSEHSLEPSADNDLLEIPAAISVIPKAVHDVKPQLAEKIAAPVEAPKTGPSPLPVQAQTPAASPVPPQFLAKDPVDGSAAPPKSPVPETRPLDLDLLSAEILTMAEDDDAVKRRKPVRVIAAISFAALLIAAAIWGVRNFGDSQSSPAAVFAETPTSLEPHAKTIPEPAIPATDPSSETSYGSQAMPEQSQAGVEKRQEQRAQIAAAKPIRAAEKRPVSATEAKPKKKLTVDDLINDN